MAVNLRTGGDGLKFTSNSTGAFGKSIPNPLDTPILHSISFIPKYGDRSFEELRWEHYLQKSKSSNCDVRPKTTQSKLSLSHKDYNIDTQLSEIAASLDLNCDADKSMSGNTSTTLFTSGRLKSGDFPTTPKVSQVHPIGTIFPFKQTKGEDRVTRNGAERTLNTSLDNLCFMNEYVNKSMEELRWDDYVANRVTCTPLHHCRRYEQNKTDRVATTLPESGLETREPRIQFKPTSVANSSKSSLAERGNVEMDSISHMMQSMSAMPDFDCKSFDEIRLDDYLAKRFTPDESRDETQNSSANEKASAPADPNPTECVICFDKAADTVILKCRHACFCLSCITKLMFDCQPSTAKCPTCRSPIEDFIQFIQ